VATVPYQCDHCYRYGAVAPTTGDSCFRALPSLNSRACQRWLDGFAAFPASLHLLVLDNGAGHTAKTGRWPSHVVPVLLPPIAQHSIP
jgi:hypothetical protein